MYLSLQRLQRHVSVIHFCLDSKISRGQDVSYQSKLRALKCGDLNISWFIGSTPRPTLFSIYIKDWLNEVSLATPIWRSTKSKNIHLSFTRTLQRGLRLNFSKCYIMNSLPHLALLLGYRLKWNIFREGLLIHVEDCKILLCKIYKYTNVLLLLLLSFTFYLEYSSVPVQT